MIVSKMLQRLLDVPIVFQLQQKICNNYLNVATAFASYLEIYDKDILDVGCSTAACADEIINMKNNRYIGIDIDLRYVNLARRIHPDGRFIQQDARHLPFDTKSFDVVMFNGVWHHMDDDLIRECMEEVKRVLRPTGVLLVSEPVFRHDWPVSTFFLKNDRGKFIRTREGYRSLFNGLEIVEEVTFQLAIHEFCGFVARPHLSAD
jgi:SAM-dependent methyltransferase